MLVEKSTDAGVTWADWSASDFETGITSASWTTVNTPAPGSSKHFVDHYLAKVKDDPTNAQDERLMTKEYTFSDNSLTSLKFSVNWFAFSNTSGIYGAYLYASTDHGTTFNFIDDISTTSTDQNSVQQISFSLLNSYKGKSVMFAIYFTDGAGNIEDFFVDSLKVHQVFDGTVGNDAKITLGDLDTLIYPVLDKYNAVAPTGIKEGFWQVAPEEWTLTRTADTTWARAQSIGTQAHDWAAHIDTIGANKDAMNETLTSQTIALKYPSVGGSYYLSFEWRTNTDRNCGLNTNPNLGTGVKYDFADVIVEIRTHNGTSWSGWTKIWQEDDEDILSTTTSDDNTSSYFTPWTNFQDYLNNPGVWYKAELNITQYAVGNKSIEVRFNYKGNGAQAGYFSLDNFYILRNANPQFELETAVPVSVSNAYHIDYTTIPLSQITNPVKLGARLTNYGIKTFTNADVTIVVNKNSTGNKTYGYRTVKPADFTTWPSTKYGEADNRAVEYTNGINLESGSTYTVTASGEINSNSLTSSQTFTIDPTLFTKYDTWGAGTCIGADTISGGKGSIFEIKVKDKIDKVSVWLGSVTSGSEFYMTVIQLADPDATSGTVVYTSPRKALPGSNQTFTFDIDLTLNPGFLCLYV